MSAVEPKETLAVIRYSSFVKTPNSMSRIAVGLFRVFAFNEQRITANVT